MTTELINLLERLGQTGGKTRGEILEVEEQILALNIHNLSTEDRRNLENCLSLYQSLNGGYHDPNNPLDALLEILQC